jgi:hypothetical protein
MILDIINFFINWVILFSLFYNASIVLKIVYDKGYVGNIYIYLNNKVFHFITNLQSGLSKKLLKYNGLFSDSDSSAESDYSSVDSSSDTDSSSSSSSDKVDSVVVPEIKYEDKYLDDIKKMSMEYRFSWSEIEIRDNKFTELYNAHKINLVNEKYKLNQEIVDNGMKYVEMDDVCNYNNGYENINDEVNSDEFCDIKKISEIENQDKKKEIDSKKKELEDDIVMLRSKLIELEEISDDEVIAKLKLEARDFVIKERLDSLKNNFIMEKTPLGNVIMYWNNSRESFEFYTDNTIPYRYLETVGRKYVKTFNCRQIYVDMEFELSEFERKQKEKQQEIELKKVLEEKQKMELEQNTNLGLIKKKDVFAKFKNYNKESGTGKVNRGVAPPKNSIPNNNMKKSDENVILKENANRYTCEGRLVNFSILKKPDRKVIDKKYAMSFSEFKKSIFYEK